MELFKLFGRVMIDNKEADSSLSKTEKKGKETGLSLQKMGKLAAVGAAAVGTAAIAAGTAIFALGTKLGNTADRLLDLNSITGMSTDEIQRWQRAALVAGTETEAITKASEKLTKTMETLSKESGKGSKALDSLGISYDELASMTADERMNYLVTALSDVEDKTERAKIGTDLFGGSWKEIAPIVDLGAESMQKAKDSANIISNDDLVKANEFRIKVAEMKDEIGFFATQIAVAAMPYLNKLMDWVAQYMPVIKNAFEVALKASGEAIGFVVEWIKRIIDWIKSMASDSDSNLSKMYGKFKEIFNSIIEVVKMYIALFEELWNRYGENIIAIIKAVWDIVVSVFQLAVDLVVDIFKIFIALFKGDWEGLWEAVKNFFKNIWDNIGNIFEKVWAYIVEVLKLYLAVFMDVLKSVLTAIADYFTRKWNEMKDGTINAFTALKDRVLAIWDGIKDGIKNAVNFVVGAINKFINGINNIKISVPSVDIPLVGKVGGFTIGLPKIPNIPMLAEGGDILEDGRVLVGEKGPEFLDLPKGARVTPLDKAGPQQLVIIVELDGRQIAKSVGQPLADLIRVKTGLKI